MNSGRVLVRLTAALLVAGIANACTNDRGASADLGPRASLSERARVSGTIRDSVELVGVTPGLGPHVSAAPFRAEVRGGHAVSDSGSLVATTRGLRTGRGARTFTDKDGHRNELILESDAPGEPATRFSHYRDGRLLARVEFRWDRRLGGWALKERALTLFQDGQPFARSHRTVDVEQVAARDNDRMTRIAEQALAAISPRPLEAQVLMCLDTEIMVGLMVSAVFAAAFAFRAVPSFGTFIACVAAIAAYDKAVDSWVNCWFAMQ